MTAEDRRYRAEQADHALKLYEQGLGRQEIAERIRVKPQNVHGMLQRARQRREKRATEVVE